MDPKSGEVLFRNLSGTAGERLHSSQSNNFGTSFFVPEMEMIL